MAKRLKDTSTIGGWATLLLSYVATTFGVPVEVATAIAGILITLIPDSKFVF